MKIPQRRTTFLLFSLPAGLLSVALLSVALHAQTGQQPPPFTAPDPPTPVASQAPGQTTLPAQNVPAIPPDAPLPQPDRSTIDLRDLSTLSPQPATPEPRSSSATAQPVRQLPPAAKSNPFNILAAYRSRELPQFNYANSPDRLERLIHNGKLYLTLNDALALAIENNLDVEISRYSLLLATTDLKRAQGGANLRGLDYSIQQTPAGIGAATSPLLIMSTTGNAASSNVTVVDLSQVMQTGNSAQQSLSQNNTSTFSLGPALPLFDPNLTVQAGYLRRSNQTSLINTTTTDAASDSGSNGTSASGGALDYVSTGVDYQQGFATGAQLEAYADNASQVLYAANSQYNPIHSPSTSVTLTQPLLRGFGRGINLRFIRIAKLDQNASRFVFEQQLLETVYGISRLYYDLVSLGENVGVREQSLAAARKLYEDDENQVNEGTLPPIELIRTRALLSSSRLDLIQAQGEYRQQEIILRQQLLRKAASPTASFATIVAIDNIAVPDKTPSMNVPQLITDALTHRPELAQASLQVQSNEISVKASRNNVRPLINLYANVETRGSSIVPYQTLGSAGDGIVAVPQALTQGGLRLSTIYQGGLQINVPLRNRIAQADAARDQIQLRQSQGRTVRLENEIRTQIENAAVAVETAHQAYVAAVESRDFQQQLLQAEIDKFSVGASTNLLIVQDQAYLAQARSTEVAARSNWMKSRLSLDHALGDLLAKNNIILEDAIAGQLK